MIGTGKLQVRQLAEQLAAAVNNAPLSSSDGTSSTSTDPSAGIPTYRETGPGTNVVFFKRYSSSSSRSSAGRQCSEVANV